MNRLRKTGIMIHKEEPRLKAEMIRAGVDILEMAAVWGVAPSTVRQRLAGFSGMTMADIARASAFCERRRLENEGGTPTPEQPSAPPPADTLTEEAPGADGNYTEQG